MGGWIGGQADYVMVPFADFNLLRLGRDPAQAMDKILVRGPPSCPPPLPFLTFSIRAQQQNSFSSPPLTTTACTNLTPTAKRSQMLHDPPSQDLALLSDILPTGYHGCIQAGVTAGPLPHHLD